MYHFNHRLIEKLPSIMGLSKKETVALLGTTHATFQRWEAGEIRCSSLVDICNACRISLSSFLVLRGDEPLMDRRSDYVVPERQWEPVEWHPEICACLFGPEGMTGVTKSEAVSRLGLAFAGIFDRWASKPTSLYMRNLLNMLNEFRLDASLFFKDPNSPLPLPEWTVPEKHVADVLSERLEGYRELERMNAQGQQEIRRLRAEKERLSRENALLREQQARRQESAFPFTQKGYTFHTELWERLPEIFDMDRREFCAAVGINYSGMLVNRNIPVSSLVAACNLLHMSVSHFFLPKGEVAAVHDKGYYEISPRMFVEVEDCMDNMKYMFGRYSVLGISMEEGGRQVPSYSGMSSMARKGGTGRVLTLCDICTTFGIPPMVFFNDANRCKAPYAVSANERLLMNAVDMMKEIRELREEVRKLKKK